MHKKALVRTVWKWYLLMRMPILTYGAFQIFISLLAAKINFAKCLQCRPDLDLNRLTLWLRSWKSFLKSYILKKMSADDNTPVICKQGTAGTLTFRLQLPAITYTLRGHQAGKTTAVSLCSLVSFTAIFILLRQFSPHFGDSVKKERHFRPSPRSVWGIGWGSWLQMTGTSKPIYTSWHITKTWKISQHTRVKTFP